MPELPSVEIKQTSKKQPELQTANPTKTAAEKAVRDTAVPRKRTPEEREQARKRMRIIVAVFSSLVLLATYFVLLAFS